MKHRLQKKQILPKNSTGSGYCVDLGRRRNTAKNPLASLKKRRQIGWVREVPPSQEWQEKFGITGQFVFSKRLLRNGFRKEWFDEGKKIKTPESSKHCFWKMQPKAQICIDRSGTAKIVLEIKKLKNNADQKWLIPKKRQWPYQYPVSAQKHGTHDTVLPPLANTTRRKLPPFVSINAPSCWRWKSCPTLRNRKSENIRILRVSEFIEPSP